MGDDHDALKELQEGPIIRRIFGKFRPAIPGLVVSRGGDVEHLVAEHRMLGDVPEQRSHDLLLKPDAGEPVTVHPLIPLQLVSMASTVLEQDFDPLGFQLGLEPVRQLLLVPEIIVGQFHHVGDLGPDAVAVVDRLRPMLIRQEIFGEIQSLH